MSGRRRGRHALDSTSAASAGPPPLQPHKRRRAGSPEHPPSAAQRCDTDSLGSIFGFLELPELAYAARTSGQWLHAAEKAASLRWQVKTPPSRWPELARSRLRRHIGALRFSRYGHGIGRRVEPLSLSTLTSLLPALPTLLQLDVFLAHEQTHGAGLPLPPTLRALKLSFVSEPSAATAQMISSAIRSCPQLLDVQVHISSDRIGPSAKIHVSDAFVQCMIDACGSCTELQTMELSFPGPASEATATDIDLAPLLHCNALQRLHLSGMLLKPAHMRVIKQLPQLRWIDVGTLSSELLAELCTPPHQLNQLEILNCREAKLGVAEMQHVIQIPSLTCLHAQHYTDAALAFLPRLPLRDLSFSGGFATNDFDSFECMFAAMLQCHAVQRLRLSYVTLSRQQGEALMTAMAQLQCLTLWNCPLPDGLAFLKRAPPSFRNLELERCYSLEPRVLLRDLKHVPQLEVLLLNECFQLTKAQLKQLNPPSKLLPQLKVFDHIPYEG